MTKKISPGYKTSISFQGLVLSSVRWSAEDHSTSFLFLPGAAALCGWDATEGGEEGPKGKEPSTGVEHDGSGQGAETGPSTHYTPRQRGFI